MWTGGRSPWPPGSVPATPRCSVPGAGSRVRPPARRPRAARRRCASGAATRSRRTSACLAVRPVACDAAAALAEGSAPPTGCPACSVLGSADARRPSPGGLHEAREFDDRAGGLEHGLAVGSGRPPTAARWRSSRWRRPSGRPTYAARSACTASADRPAPWWRAPAGHGTVRPPDGCTRVPPGRPRSAWCTAWAHRTGRPCRNGTPRHCAPLRWPPARA